RVDTAERIAVRGQQGQGGVQVGPAQDCHDRTLSIPRGLQGPAVRSGYGGPVHRNLYTLAALAAAAVPGLVPVRTAAVATPIADLDVAGVIGEDDRRVIAMAPSSTGTAVQPVRHRQYNKPFPGTTWGTANHPV